MTIRCRLDRNLLPRLTIVLPLKGRHLFTMRFLWHANKAKLPYRFLLADGHVNEVVARNLENTRDDFPELDIQYIRYPDDADYSCFFAKMVDAVQHVRTPYAMLADNDDFLCGDGIEQALDFLDANADYVCARGRVVGFAVSSEPGNQNGGVHGRINRIFVPKDLADVTAGLATERLRQGGLSVLNYYGVYRTEALATLLREDAEIDFSDLLLFETFHAMRTATLGKACMNKAAISYFSQDGTSITQQPSCDWGGRLQRSRFTSDVDTLVSYISKTAATTDGVNEAAVAEDVRAMLEGYFREILSSDRGLIAKFKRILRKKWPRMESYLQFRHRLSVRRKRSALLVQLADCGASPNQIECTNTEFAAIESALSQEAFASFAGPFLPLVRAGGRDWV